MTTSNRLYSKVEILDNGCWRYTGGLNGRGYGNFWLDGKTCSAHVVSFELHNGPVLEGMQVCHSCDYKPCINPEHLFVGTQQDNTDDMIAKGRGRFKGEESGQAKLTAEDVMYIKRLIEDGYSVSSIADLYNMTYQAIRHIKIGRSWRHVQ